MVLNAVPVMLNLCSFSVASHTHVPSWIILDPCFVHRVKFASKQGSDSRPVAHWDLSGPLAWSTGMKFTHWEESFSTRFAYGFISLCCDPSVGHRPCPGTI